MKILDSAMLGWLPPSRGNKGKSGPTRTDLAKAKHCTFTKGFITLSARGPDSGYPKTCWQV